jgi:GAF domain-containing protein
MKLTEFTQEHGAEAGASQSHVDKLRAVLNICRRMSSTTDLSSLQALITREAKELLQADRVSVFLFNRDNCELWSVISQEGMVMRFDARLGIAGAVAMTGRAINVADAYEHPLFYKEVDVETGYHTQTLLAVPLHGLDGAVIGVGEATNKIGGVFTDEDAEILTSLAARLADILQHSAIAAEVNTENLERCGYPAAQLISGFSTRNIRRHERPDTVDCPAHRSDSPKFGRRAHSRGERHWQRTGRQSTAF